MRCCSVIGNIYLDKPITIVGAGISGLLLGFFLKKNSISFRILEQKDRAGGLIHTYTTAYGIIETAANGFLMNEAIQEIINTCNANEVLLPPSNHRKRYIVKNGKINKALFTIPTICKAIWNLNFSKTIPSETVSDFIRNHIKSQNIHNTIEAAISGIYAAPLDKLSLELIAPQLLADQLKGKNKLNEIITLYKTLPRGGTRVLKGGMQSFINLLTDYLHNEIEYKVDLSQASTNVIYTVPSYRLPQLIPDDGIHRICATIHYQAIYSITFFCPLQQHLHIPKGFGCLIPRAEGYYSLGILFNHNIFPANYNDGIASYTCIINADENTHFKNMSDIEIENIIISDMQRIGLPMPTIIGSRVTRWDQGIPLYNTHLAQALHDFRSYLANKNIAIFGNYTGSLSIRRLATNAKIFTENLLYQ